MVQITNRVLRRWLVAGGMAAAAACAQAMPAELPLLASVEHRYGGAHNGLAPAVASRDGCSSMLGVAVRGDGSCARFSDWFDLSTVQGPIGTLVLTLEFYTAADFDGAWFLRTGLLTKGGTNMPAPALLAAEAGKHVARFAIDAGTPMYDGLVIGDRFALGFTGTADSPGFWLAGARLDVLAADVGEVPEPGSLPLLAAGLGVAAWVRRRTRP